MMHPLKNVTVEINSICCNKCGQRLPEPIDVFPKWGEVIERIRELGFVATWAFAVEASIVRARNGNLVLAFRSPAVTRLFLHKPHREELQAAILLVTGEFWRVYVDERWGA